MAENLTESLTHFNVTHLLKHPNLMEVLEKIPPFKIYQGLVQHGFEDSLELIEKLKGEQLKAVLDHDLWTFSKSDFADVPSSERFLEWIRYWVACEPNDLTKFIAEKVWDCEEELLELVFGGMLEVVPVGLEGKEFSPSDDHWLTTDRAYWLKVRPEISEDYFEVVHHLIHNLYQSDARKIQSLLASCALLNRAELLEMAQKWREARLADQGFLSRDEAARLMQYRKFNVLKEGLMAQVDIEEQRRRFAPWTREQNDVNLFLNQEEGLKISGSKSDLLVEIVFKELDQHFSEESTWYKERLLYIVNGVLSYLSAAQGASSVEMMNIAFEKVIGEINIGLENILSEPNVRDLVLNRASWLEDSSYNSLSMAAHVLAAVGPEILFHLGHAFVGQEIKSHLSLVDLKEVMDEEFSDVSEAARRILSHFMGDNPMYPLVLDQFARREEVHRLGDEKRALQTLRDLDNFANFMKNLKVSLSQEGNE